MEKAAEKRLFPCFRVLETRAGKRSTPVSYFRINGHRSPPLLVRTQ
jgi:hypothetical protein